MRSVADALRSEERRALDAFLPAARVRLALALGRRDLEAFRSGQQGVLSAEAAARVLDRRRQASRRRCRCLAEIIG